ncbi:MAG: VOC family protein [Planctomycetaceae bacterium]|nr:VOC family protein [Planctomycetaceae bacterium]
MEDSPLRVKAIDHITLVVKDLERSRQFYCDALGMRQVPRPAFDFDGRWFQAGATLIHLILEHDHSGPAGHGAAVTSRGHHFAFEVDDGHAAARRLTELNLPIVSGPKERPDGAVQVFLQDPDGYLVELCSPPR